MAARTDHSAGWPVGRERAREGVTAQLAAGGSPITLLLVVDDHGPLLLPHADPRLAARLTRDGLAEWHAKIGDVLDVLDGTRSSARR